MPVEVPPFVKAIIDDFDRSLGPLDEGQLMSAIAGATPVGGTASSEEQKGYTAELCAFQFHPRPDGAESVWGTYFGPRFSREENGKPIHSPDVAQLDGEAVEHWQWRSTEVRHPVLKARYADLAWDLKRSITNEAPDVAFAISAIDAYVEATDRALYRNCMVGIWWATRALNLAISISNGPDVDVARDAMFRLFDRIAVPKMLGTWPFLFDTLYGNKKVPLLPVQERRIIDSLEDILSECATEGAGFKHLAAKEAAVRLAQHYRHVGQVDDVKRVYRVSGNAFEAYAAQSGASVAMFWLQQVYEDYHREGMMEEAHRVHLSLEVRAKDVGGEMKRISAQIQISDAEIENFLGKMTAGDLRSTLDRIAIHFIPSANRALSCSNLGLRLPR